MNRISIALLIQSLDCHYKPARSIKIDGQNRFDRPMPFHSSNRRHCAPLKWGKAVESRGKDGKIGGMEGGGDCLNHGLRRLHGFRGLEAGCWTICERVARLGRRERQWPVAGGQ